MATLFRAQNALISLAHEFRWAGMGNLLEDYGEFVAVAHYGLTKAGGGAARIDAVTRDGRSVQVKARHAAGQIGFRGEADLMLVIKVCLDGSWEQVHFGDFAAVRAIARYSSRDNKHMAPVTKLRQLSETELQISN